MIPEPGPRDWLPSSPPRNARTASLIADPRPRNRSIGPAILSTIFGVAATVYAVAPFVPNATAGRFVVSSIGLTAIYAGIRSIRARRGLPALASSIFSTVGIGCGAIGTLVMAATWTSGGSIPAMVAHAVAQHSTVAQVAEPPVPAPQRVAASPSLGSMEQAVGTLAFVMKRLHSPGSRWPAVLDVSSDGAVTVPGTSGVLVRLPLGTRLGYRTATDDSAYAVRLSDSSDPSRYVDYDTNFGVVTIGPAA
jgi:hypothetical protein